MKYDYLIVGAGLFGSTVAYELTKKGKKCLVIEKRKHIGGNLYKEKKDDINIHIYGAHIFHTSDKQIWDYLNNIVPFHSFTNSPLALYKGKLYNLPFNMNTFYEIWGLMTPEDVKAKINKEKIKLNRDPKNLEEQALSLVGKEIYEILIKSYTEKQWGRKCTELPPDIIKRLPLRFRYDNNYFNDAYQGIPEDGYSAIFDILLEGIDVELDVDFNTDRDKYKSIANKVIYTGMLDALYDFKLGELEYRSERFEHKKVSINNVQGVAVINYTDNTPQYTRSIEHKHFEFWKNINNDVTWISYEYPVDYKETGEPYYPINNERNQKLYDAYKALADRDGYILGGRLALYKYFDMDKTIAEALKLGKI